MNCSELRAEIDRIAWRIVDLPSDQAAAILREEVSRLPPDARDVILAYSTTKALTVNKPRPINWEKITAFAFGVLFLVTLLVIAFNVPTPSSFQAFIFRVVLSVAAAAFVAFVPGFINVESKFRGFWVRAGGALAIFVVVYLINPPELIQKNQDKQPSDSITSLDSPSPAPKPK